MKKDSFVSYFLGSISYIIFIYLVWFQNGLQMVERLIPAPPLPISPVNIILGAFAFPLIFWYVAKIMKVKVSVSETFLGFLLTAAILGTGKILIELSN